MLATAMRRLAWYVRYADYWFTRRRCPAGDRRAVDGRGIACRDVRTWEADGAGRRSRPRREEEHHDRHTIPGRLRTMAALSASSSSSPARAPARRVGRPERRRAIGRRPEHRTVHAPASPPPPSAAASSADRPRLDRQQGHDRRRDQGRGRRRRQPDRRQLDVRGQRRARQPVPDSTSRTRTAPTSSSTTSASSRPSEYLTKLAAAQKAGNQAPYDVIAVEENYWYDASQQGLVDDALPSDLIPNQSWCSTASSTRPSRSRSSRPPTRASSTTRTRPRFLKTLMDLADPRLKGKVTMPGAR